MMRSWIPPDIWPAAPAAARRSAKDVEVEKVASDEDHKDDDDHKDGRGKALASTASCRRRREKYIAAPDRAAQVDSAGVCSEKSIRAKCAHADWGREGAAG